MKLAHLLQALSLPLPKCEDVEINHITFDSKQVHKGGLFVAIPGFTSDGHDYIANAVLAGASAIIGERPISGLPIPYLKVPNARLALAELAAELYGHPDQDHTMIGITGTNGKTTTAYMIRHILEYAGQSCALFGTIERYTNKRKHPSLMTTPDAVTLQQWLLESIDHHVVMEVSSHGLSQSRVDGIRFDYAIFTNLSHEHLDYHQTLERYFESKARLFQLLKSRGEALINTHGSWGRKLAAQLRLEGMPISTFGPHENDTLQLLHINNVINPVFEVRESNEIHRLNLSISGLHNIWNAMAAILFARRNSIPFSVIAGALSSFPGVPGRLETYLHPNGAHVVIDYAHTPDGLEQCLQAVKATNPLRLVHVFGFRGRRDSSKWETMMDISTTLCDETILTLDDLNDVPYDQMMSHYEQFKQVGLAAVIPDRTLAIQEAWNQLESRDCLVITGKGPENYQTSFELPTQSDPDTILYLQQVNVHHSNSSFPALHASPLPDPLRELTSHS
jgi:UDP-N-acetylmuramoyl-L-alanyl-D-glutamate--2,6-diaminopimelate ligase